VDKFDESVDKVHEFVDKFDGLVDKFDEFVDKVHEPVDKFDGLIELVNELNIMLIIHHFDHLKIKNKP
jgi:phage-related minor tail protein